MATCSVEGCGTHTMARGWCSKHYQRWKAYGTTDGRAKEAAPCAVEGCERPVGNGGRGWCPGHYARWRKHGDPGTTPIGRRSLKGRCEAEGCERPARRRQWCEMHYARWSAHGDPNRKPGRTPLPERKAHNGYVMVWAPDHPHAQKGRVFGHRLAMERAIGRVLLPGESVHHRNGVRDDNRIENLELWVSHHPNGQRVEDKVQWAVEFLLRYAPELLR